jgi:hypothetical protein
MSALRRLAVEPNPTRGAFHVRGARTGNASARLSIVDVAGRTVLRRSVEAAGAFDIEIGDVPLAPGLYLVRLEDADRTAVAKVLVLR